MYRKIVTIEMNQNGINFHTDMVIPVKWERQVLLNHLSTHLLIEDGVLLNVRALLDQPSQYDVAQTRTYLNALGLKIGIIVNFGKKQLQIHGICPD